MPDDFLITPINERYQGIAQFKQVMHLDKEESKDLNQIINQIATLQIQQKNEALPLNSLPQNGTDFLKIHKKIESLQKTEKDPVLRRLLDQINHTSRKFEQIVLRSLNSGNARDLQEVKELYSQLNRLNTNPLTEKRITSALRDDLKALEETMKSVNDNYEKILSIDNRMASFEEKVDEAIESLAVRQAELESGQVQLSLEEDISVLKLIDQLIGFYKTYENEESLPLYHGQFISRLQEEVYALRFHLGELRAEYQDAVKVEVLKVLQAIQKEGAASSAEERYHALLGTLIEEKGKLELEKAVLDGHIEMLDPQQKGAEALFREFRELQKQLAADLKFFENQIRMLSEKQTVGIWGRWTISGRDKKIEHNVRIVREVEENIPNGSGKSLLLLSVWGLSKIGKFTAFSQFVNQSYQAISTGESPLKSTAELMSLQAFAKQFSGLEIGRQQVIEYDTSAIQGVLNGFIAFTKGFAEDHPDAAAYLQNFKSEVPVSENRMSNSSGSNFIQHLPIEIMTKSEANIQAMRYVGEQVREHYVAEGKQLEFENPNPLLVNEFYIHQAEVRPASAFSLLAKELVYSIKEAKSGVPLEENASFQMLQADAKATFGSEIPSDWFSGWIVPQEWDREKLANFQGWVADNLECQARHHLANSNIHMRNEATAVVSTVPNTAAIDIQGAVEMDVNASPHVRHFNVIEHLADEINPEQLFRDPLTRDTPRLSSPLQTAMDVYTFVAGKAQLF